MAYTYSFGALFLDIFAINEVLTRELLWLRQEASGKDWKSYPMLHRGATIVPSRCCVLVVFLSALISPKSKFVVVNFLAHRCDPNNITRDLEFVLTPLVRSKETNQNRRPSPVVRIGKAIEQVQSKMFGAP
ncbi:Protein argonaute 4-like protein [Gossypium australe]|uniref:Protein argonaute 4-like protein n=1 Tax=Gossypium australe TaxID=47621 RepID=A0A5B6VY91_9ROSI|nr:Protein argonaute 4-like protein [Gossypium australe]